VATGSTATRTCSSPGQPGSGKSWIACALGHKACRDNHRVPRLFEALALARGDGRYGRLLKSLGRVQLLVLDDWGLSVLNPPEHRDLLEILDDRHGRPSTIVTSQIQPGYRGCFPIELFNESNNPGESNFSGSTFQTFI
jgi:DNA replication protein DnaC